MKMAESSGLEIEGPTPATAPIVSERRLGSDRRHRPTGFWDFLKLEGRRARGRRVEDALNSYVDAYRPADLILLVGIFVLNLLDAVLTLQWLQMGGTESNPVMDWLIRSGDGLFIAQKCFVVGIWLVILTAHKNFRIARLGLWSLLVLYSCVTVYHMLLRAPYAPVG